MKLQYKLYLDDERIPSSDWAKDGLPVIIVRNVGDFKAIINTFGLPVSISFDHDLGDNLPTGYNAVQWLVNDKEFDLRKVEIHVHSANPVGTKNIYGLVESWNKFLNSQK